MCWPARVDRDRQVLRRRSYIFWQDLQRNAFPNARRGAQPPWHGRCCYGSNQMEARMARETVRYSAGRIGYALLWLVGVPLPIVLVLYMFLH